MMLSTIRAIRPGDRISVTLTGLKRELEVVGIAAKPVSREIARSLYEEISREVTETGDHRASLRRRRLIARMAGHDKIKGRPTKKERRLLDKLRKR